MYTTLSSLLRTQSFADITAKNPATGSWKNLCLSAIGAHPDANISAMHHVYDDGTEVFMYVDDELCLTAIRDADRKKMRLDICAKVPGKSESILQSMRKSIGEHTANYKTMARGHVPQHQTIQIRDKARAMGARMATSDMVLLSPVEPETVIGTVNHVLKGPILISGADMNDHISIVHPHQDGAQTHLSVFRYGKDNEMGFSECLLSPEKTALSLSLLTPNIHALEILLRIRHDLPAERAHMTTIGREPVMKTSTDPGAKKSISPQQKMGCPIHMIYS